MKLLIAVLLTCITLYVFANPLVTRLTINQFIQPNKNYNVKQARFYGAKKTTTKLKTFRSQVHIINLGWKFRKSSHPKTGIRYDQYGFPKFESIYNFRVPDNLIGASNSVQFRAATRSLRRKIKLDATLQQKFTPLQLQQINQGLPQIDGYSWHHNQAKSTGLQLVDREIHAQTPHTGGDALWNYLQY